MNKRKSIMHLGIGAPSLLMIFIVLVMCILAVLTYLRANATYESTLRHVDLTAQYYQCEKELLDIYYQLDTNHIEQQLQNYHVDYQKDQRTYTLFRDINEESQLQLQFQIDNDQLQIVSFYRSDKEENYGG